MPRRIAGILAIPNSAASLLETILHFGVNFLVVLQVIFYEGFLALKFVALIKLFQPPVGADAEQPVNRTYAPEAGNCQRKSEQKTGKRCAVGDVSRKNQ